VVVCVLAVVAALLGAVYARGAARAAGGWPAPNADLASTRSASGSSIDAANVGGLKPAWRFRFEGYQTPSGAGVYASNPIVLDGRVYLQDLDSDVFVLDARSGRRIWTAHARQVSGGPNGLAAGDGRIYANTNLSAFALDAKTGKVLWRRKLVHGKDQAIDIAPQFANGLVYDSTVGVPPGGKGVIYALDAATGAIRWKFRTILGDWAVPTVAAGGGAWWSASVGSDGDVYFGTSNPVPWGGTPKLPNGAAYRGDDLYTDSLLDLDGSTGSLKWYAQATRHDVRDYDFSSSPILAQQPIGGTTQSVVFGAGKAGVVYARDARTGRLYWKRAVGKHRNDVGPLPRRKVQVCPGLYGGVETPMAYAAETLFVPVVDLCMQGSATGYEPLNGVDIASRGRGELAALDASTGKPVWTRHFPVPVFACATVANDVVFTASPDGHVYGLSARDGHTLWQARMRAAVNACPAVDGDQLLVGAGADFSTLRNERYERVAFRVPR